MKNGNAAKYFFCLVIVWVLSVQFVFAQPGTDSSKENGLRSFIKLSVSWHNGLEWEKKISRASVIDLFGGMLISKASDDFLDYKARFIISPDAYAEYRNYYNLFRRINKQKRTRNNSANFLFGRVEVIFSVKNQNFLNLVVSQGWGAQRSLCKKILVGYHLGIIEHFYYDKTPDGGFNYLKFEPTGEFCFSYVF